MMRCTVCRSLVGACSHEAPAYEDGTKPGPGGQMWLGIASAVVVLAFVLLVWHLAAVAA